MKKNIFRFLLLYGICCYRSFCSPSINTVVANQTVKKYDKFEITVNISAQYTNPYDPDQVDLSCRFVSPTNKEWNIFGFYDGTNWKVRFTPNEVGIWRYKIILKDQTGQAESQTYTFECSSSNYHGWIKVAPNKRYLMYDDGTPFYGIGHCRAWAATATPFDTLKQYGMNMVLIWVGPPWMGMLENTSKGIGVYDQSICFAIENYISLAEQNDIHIILVLWPHDALRVPGIPWSGGNWSKNAYSQITTPEGFYQNTDEVWNYQKKLYRYFIARWGYSRALAIWGIVSEINGTTGYAIDSQSAEQWCSRVHNFFKQNDPYNKPTCGSKSGDQYWNNGYNIFDIAEMHTYKDKSNANSVADTIISYTRQMWSGFLKPNFIGEFGTDNQNLQPLHIHNGIWSALAAGAAITPLDWNDGGSWGDMTDSMLQHMQIFSNFVKDIDFVNNNFEPATISVTPNGDAVAMKSDKYTFGWIRNAQSNVERVINISGLYDGLYEVKLYDTWTGEYFYVSTSSCNYGFLSISIPQFSKTDFAFKAYIKQDNTGNNQDNENTQQPITYNLEGKLLKLLPPSKNPVKVSEDKEAIIKFLVNTHVPTKVKVVIYDINMRLVKVLTEGNDGWTKVNIPYQELKWNLKNSNGEEVSSGIYIYKVDVVNDYKVKRSAVGKIMVIK